MAEDYSNTSDDAGHEPLTVSVRAVAIGITALFGLVVASFLVIAGLYLYLASARGGEPVVGAPEPPVEVPIGVPSLNFDQRGSLHALRARENELLSEYAWVDRDVARIPIRRAMEILGQQSTPTDERADETRDE